MGEKLNQVIKFSMMKVIVLFTIILMCFHELNAENYYIDASRGGDNNTGLSPEEAWASLNKVNAQSFSPGDSILFKAGEIWAGQLLIDDKGTVNKTIVYTKYGEGHKPQLKGKGGLIYTVKLEDASYTEFSEFDISNKGENVLAGRLGIYILAMNGDIPGVVVKNVDVHDVNGQVDKNLQSRETGAGSGIYWSNRNSTDGRLVDALIQGCHVYNCERNGISGAINRNIRHLRLRVRQNLIERVPGDAIIMNTCDDGIAEFNIARDFPKTLPEGNAAAGIWPFNSNNTIIQFNEVSGHSAPLDGQGFDSDFWCTGTIIQYNYSHDNCGGFVLVCGNKDRSPDGESSPNTGTIIRYNISINDGGRTWGEHAHDFPLVYFHGHPEGTNIYNNTFYYGDKISELEGVAPHFIKATWGEPWSTGIYNNIFASLMPGGKIDMNLHKNTIIDSNLYFNVPTIEDREGEITDGNKIIGNPKFVNLQGHTPEDYQLTEGSPALQAGILIPNNGGRDFFGNAVSDKEAPNVGADNSAKWVGIFDAPTQGELFISYPNITKEEFYLDVKEPLRNAAIRITALNGVVVKQLNFSYLDRGVLKFDLGQYRSGMYIVSLQAGSKKQIKRMIKI